MQPFPVRPLVTTSVPHLCVCDTLIQSWEGFMRELTTEELDVVVGGYPVVVDY